MTEDRVVIRNRTGRLAFGAAAALAVFLVGDAVVRGSFGVAGIGAAVLGALLALVYLLLVRPRVIVSSDGITRCSALRTARFTWDEVEGIRLGSSVTIVLRDGRVVRSWLATPERSDSADVERIRTLAF